MTGEVQTRQTGWLPVVVSFTFWITFLASAGLLTVLTLSPGLEELSKLRERYHFYHVGANELRREVAHLEKLAAALEHDADFVLRLHQQEFHLQDPDEIQIPVSEGLNYDARIPVSSEATDSLTELQTPSPWLSPWWGRLNEDSFSRRRLQVVVVGLVLFAFCCLNEDFFSGGLGAMFVGFLRWLGNRYRKRPTAGESA